MLWFNPAKRHGFIQTDEGERLRVDQDGFAAGEPLQDGCRGTRVSFDRTAGEADDASRRQCLGRAAVCGAAGAVAGASLMGRRSPAVSTETGTRAGAAREA